MKMKVLTFYLCESLLGIDVTLVKEINRNVDFSVVPGSQQYIVGFLNMRGQVVTLFNLANLINLESENIQKAHTCIILKSPKDPDQVGFLIDHPGDVIDIDQEECELPPANVGGVEGEFISSIVKLENELLIIIDPTKIFKDQRNIEG
ncbi:MAG: chemotaxis protein CheW [Firmicutes bacterium HGW-Firmicutes-1]|jgi:purine-binding chemotaxis protein CheW|nr:MAG: chemotaxis protein CheW [Firmicutes bacterium HGW-Firmicutes-1]